MQEGYLLALDAGTGSFRAVLFDLSGHQVKIQQTEWTHSVDARWPGSMNFDWEEDWKIVVSCLRGLFSDGSIRPEQILGLSTTCMREGIVLYDADGNEIWACANVDSRSDEEAASLARRSDGLEMRLYGKSGQSFALNAIPRLLWVKKHLPEVYQRAHRMGMFNDWLIYRLTGELAVEPSNGSTTGLMDLKTRTWDPAIAEECGLRTDLFPRVAESGTLIGVVSPAAAEETGLLAGTKVIVGGGDCQVGSIGVGAIAPGQAALFGGTFWQLESNTDALRMDARARVRINCHALPNQWQYEALAFNPGMVTRWFRDAFCAEEKQRAQAEGRDVYELLSEEASKIPAGSYGIQCTFSDIMNFTSWKHASPTFTNFGLDAEKYNKYAFFRAIMENTAYLARGHMELVDAFTGHETAELIFAGGASKSPLWCQIVADVTNRPVHVPRVKESTALGCALIAGVGVGAFSSMDEAVKTCVSLEKTCVPNPAHREVYEQGFATWRAIYPSILQLSEEGALRHMWKAPGL